MLGDSSTATVAHVVRAFASHAESRLFKPNRDRRVLKKVVTVPVSNVRQQVRMSRVLYDDIMTVKKLKSRITVCVTISAKHCSKLQLLLLYVLVPSIPFFNFQIYGQVRMAQVLKLTLENLSLVSQYMWP